MMGPGLPFELKNVETKSYKIKSKVGLNLFNDLIINNPDMLHASSKSIGYVAGENILAFSNELTTLYPDSGTKIEVSKWKMRHTEKSNLI